MKSDRSMGGLAEVDEDWVDKGVSLSTLCHCRHLRYGGKRSAIDTQLDYLPDLENPVVLFKGSTIANLRQDEVPAFISKVKELIGKKHSLLLVHDANQDEVSLMKAYDTPKMAVFMENIMCRVHRDAISIGMKPQQFRYKPEWEPATHDLKHILTATQTQKFEFEGQTVEIEAGQKFHTLSSFKYPIKVFQDLIGSTGYKPIDVILDDSNRLAAHLFEASDR